MSQKKVWDEIAATLENVLVAYIGSKNPDEICESRFIERADEISGNYNSYIENDGDTHKQATRKCNKEFFEMLKNLRDEIVGQFESDMAELFED